MRRRESVVEAGLWVDGASILGLTYSHPPHPQPAFCSIYVSSSSWRIPMSVNCQHPPPCTTGLQQGFALTAEERWTPKTGPLVKIDFPESAGDERKQTDESKTQTA